MNQMEVTEGRLLSQNNGSPTAVEVPPPPRTVETVTLEIRTLQHQAQGIILSYAIEIGRRLEEAKAMLPHGEWGNWLKKELDYSQSTAQNFMRVFREYGDAQQSLFGSAPKSQMFGNLTYSKALRLLAIPDEEEREKFVAENDVERMSIRELNEALKARNEAEERAAAAQAEADQAKAAAKAAQEALEKQQEKAQRLQDALSDANTSAQAAEEEHARLAQELEELRNHPTEADTEAVEAARKVAVAQMTERVDNANAAKKQAEEKRRAAEEALEAAQKELADLKAKEPGVRELTQEEKDALTAEAVEQAKAEGAEQIRGLEKKLAAADPNVAEFKVRFAAWQEEYQKMAEVLGRIVLVNEGLATKLQRAVKSALEQMGGGAS
jgi:phage-related minor tail protein